MYDVLIVPGSQLYRTRPDPVQMWYEAYAQQLSNVAIAQFPIPPDQNWENWSYELDSWLPQLRLGGLIVGHSLGAPATLLKLQELLNRGETTIPLSLLFIAPFLRVSAATQKYDTPELSNFSDFVGRPFDLPRIRASLNGRVRLVYATDDPFLSPETQDYHGFAHKLGAESTELESGGHFQGVEASGHLGLLLSESHSLLDSSRGRLERK